MTYARLRLRSVAAACDQAADRGTFVALTLQEIITGEKAMDKPTMKVKLYVVTDAKSLYDCLVKITPKLETATS